MSDYPEPTVGAYIRNHDGRYLFVRSHKWADGTIWTVPGGHIEIGETVEEATVREVKEEVGLTVRFIRHFETCEAIFPRKFWKKKHFFFFECECETTNDESVHIDHDEIQEAVWMTKEEALQTDLEDFTRKNIAFL